MREEVLWSATLPATASEAACEVSITDDEFVADGCKVVELYDGASQRSVTLVDGAHARALRRLVDERDNLEARVGRVPALEAEAAELRSTLNALAWAVELHLAKRKTPLSEYDPLSMALATARTVLNPEAPEPAEAPQEEPIPVTAACEGSCETHYGQVRRVYVDGAGGRGGGGEWDYCEEAIAEDRRRGFTVSLIGEPAEAGGEEGGDDK